MNALLWSALALDLVLVFVAAGTDGFAWSAGPIRIQVRDPSNPLIIAALLVAALVAVNWRHARRRAWTLVAAAAVVAAVGIVITHDAVRIFPLADIAVIELYARNALTGKLLVGPYSRFGWHHPGPAYFYLIAPLYATAGQQPAALAAGAAAILMGSFALLAWMLGRSMRSPVVLATLALLSLYIWRLPDLTASPWNPHVVVVPMMALVVGSAVLAGGDFIVLPVVVLLASFVIQTDLALAPSAGIIVAAAFTSAIVSAAGRAELQKNLKWLVGGAWVFLAAWFPPFAEQATHSPGNMTLLWRFFALNPGNGQPFGAAAAAWSKMLSAPVEARLAFDVASRSPDLIVAVLQVLGLAVVAGWSIAAGQRALTRLAGFCLLTTLVALWSATRIEERIMDHQVFWLTGIGVLNIAVIAGAAGLYLRSRSTTPAPRILMPAGAALSIAACVLVCFNQLERARAGRLPVTRSLASTEKLAWSIREHLEGRGLQKPLFRIGEGEPVWGTAAGVLLELDRLGVPFAVEESWMPMFPQAFAANGDEDSEIAVSNEATHLTMMERPGNGFIANNSAAYFDAIAVKKGL